MEEPTRQNSEIEKTNTDWGVSLYINDAILTQINDNCDWQSLFSVLGLEKDENRSKPNDWWARSPFNKNEKTASFHINPEGWYCFSTNQGGFYTKLIEKLFGLDCYNAARWIVEQNCSWYRIEKHETGAKEIVGRVVTDNPGQVYGNNQSSTEQREAENETRGKSNTEKKKENEQVQYSLIRYLKQQGSHPEFVRRGIGAETCHYLGAGYLPRGSPSMQGRIVFQVRGVEAGPDGKLFPVILSHIGRATTDEQKTTYGKWHHYRGFIKTCELFNIDKVLLDEKAMRQVQETGRVVVVEGCFDVAKLIEAGIYNVVSTFGAHLDDDQLPRFRLLADRLGDVEFLVWYDRDKAGNDGMFGNESEDRKGAVSLLAETGFKAAGFDWKAVFYNSARSIGLPESIKDACDMSVEQLQWLRKKGVI